MLNYKLFLEDIYFISKSCICVCVCVLCVYIVCMSSVFTEAVIRSYELLNVISGDVACALCSCQLSHLSIRTKNS